MNTTIIIAEFMGLKTPRNHKCPCHTEPLTCELHVYMCPDARCECTCDPIPIYNESLRSVAMAEQKIKADGGISRYLVCLWNVVNPKYSFALARNELDIVDLSEIVTATASQRADAILDYIKRLP